MRAKRFGLASLVLAAALTATACAGAAPAPEETTGGAEQPQELVPLRVATLNPIQATDYPNVIAYEKGFFEEEGLDVEIIPTPQNPAAPLLSGDVDVAGVGGNGITAIEQGQDVRFVAAWPASPTFAILVPAGSPLIDKAGQWPGVMEAMKGMKFGVTVAGAYTENVSRALFAMAGVGADEVEIIPAGDGQSLVAGLTTGAFDAGLVASPLLEPMIEQGIAESVLNLWEKPVPGWNAPVATPMMLGSFVDANPEAVSSYQRAIAKANAWAKDPANTKEFSEMMATRLNVEPETLVAPIGTFISALGETAEYTEDQWNAVVEMMLLSGGLTRELEYSEWVVPFP